MRAPELTQETVHPRTVPDLCEASGTHATLLWPPNTQAQSHLLPTAAEKGAQSPVRQAAPLPSPIHGLNWAESPRTHGLCQGG